MYTYTYIVCVYIYIYTLHVYIHLYIGTSSNLLIDVYNSFSYTRRASDCSFRENVYLSFAYTQTQRCLFQSFSHIASQQLVKWIAGFP